MPIKGLSESRRLPRLGKIHLGVKVKNASGTEYPKATDYFVCPPEVTAIYGEQPKKLDIFIPLEDDEVWASQYYRQYSRTRGLVCRGDGETCQRMVDTKNGDVAGKDTKDIVWKSLVCPGKECPDYKAKKCSESMNLQFMLPKVPGLGVWQIDSGSINSILNINSDAQLIRNLCGHLRGIPLTLSLESQEVNNPDDGKKKTIYTLHMRNESTLQDLLLASTKTLPELFLPPPAERDEPLDAAQVEKNIEELWPDDPPTAALAHTPDDSPRRCGCGEVIEAEVGQTDAGKKVRDPASIKNIGALCKACYEDFHMDTKTVFATLGVTDYRGLVDSPADCYKKVAQEVERRLKEAK